MVLAEQKKMVNLVKHLILDHHVDVDLDGDHSIICQAIEDGPSDVMKFLIEHYGHQHAIEKPCKQGDSLLLHAARAADNDPRAIKMAN